MERIPQLLLCATLLPILTAQSMDTRANNVLTQESHAVLDTQAKQQTLHALDDSPKSPRSSALELLKEVRDQRNLLPVYKQFEEPKTALLMLEKNIYYQLQLLGQENNTTLVLNQLHMLMNQAREAVIQAQCALEDKPYTKVHHNNPKNNIGQTTEKNRDAVADKGNTLRVELSQKIHANKHLAYETCLAFFKEHPELVKPLPGDALFAELHLGLIKINTQPKPLDYIVFATLLASGANREELNGKKESLLDVAMNAENMFMVQLLTTEKVTKGTLLSLAQEHQKIDLIPFLLK